MRIASFNVNSIKVRLEIVLAWLCETKIDVLAIQECKSQAENFPHEAFRKIGYHSLVVGQKAYNGVALVSRSPLVLREERLPGDTSDTQARWLLAEHEIGLIASAYCPNGNPFPGEKFDYKIAWMARLEKHLASLIKEEQALAVLGDYNLLAHEHDCYDFARMAQDALAQPAARAFYHRLLRQGFYDAWTCINGAKEGFTYWDYQGSKYESNRGLRIDYALLSPRLADCLKACYVDHQPRRASTPSDHTPLVVELST